MSMTIVSSVIAGCEVTGKLHRDVLVRGCDHPAAPSAFCPQCGKPMHVAKLRPIPGFDEADKIVVGDKTWRVAGDGRHPTPRRFAGVLLAEVVEWRPPTCTRIADVDDDTLRSLRDSLTSIGLWDPDTYGIWNVLYVS